MPTLDIHNLGSARVNTPLHALPNISSNHFADRNLVLNTSQRQSVICLCGAITADSTAQVITQVQAALQSGENAPLWIDMSRVELIDRSGFSALLAAYSLAQQRGRAVVLYQVTPPVRLILELTGLDQELHLVATLPPPVPPETV